MLPLLGDHGRGLHKFKQLMLAMACCRGSLLGFKSPSRLEGSRLGVQDCTTSLEDDWFSWYDKTVAANHLREECPIIHGMQGLRHKHGKTQTVCYLVTGMKGCQVPPATRACCNNCETSNFLAQKLINTTPPTLKRSPSYLKAPSYMKVLSWKSLCFGGCLDGHGDLVSCK